jgi:hypothetical protein
MKASEIEHRRTIFKKVADTEVSEVNFYFQQYFIIYKVKVNKMQSFTGICAYLIGRWHNKITHIFCMCNPLCHLNCDAECCSFQRWWHNRPKFSLYFC